MGEAWFMSEKRRTFDLLLGNLEELSLEELRGPLEEIASGNLTGGPSQTDRDHFPSARRIS